MASLHSGKSLLPSPSPSSLPPHESLWRPQLLSHLEKQLFPPFLSVPSPAAHKERTVKDGGGDGGGRHHPGETRDLVSYEILSLTRPFRTTPSPALPAATLGLVSAPKQTPSFQPARPPQPGVSTCSVKPQRSTEVCAQGSTGRAHVNAVSIRTRSANWIVPCDDGALPTAGKGGRSAPSEVWGEERAPGDGLVHTRTVHPKPSPRVVTSPSSTHQVTPTHPARQKETSPGSGLLYPPGDEGNGGAHSPKPLRPPIGMEA